MSKQEKVCGRFCALKHFAERFLWSVDSINFNGISFLDSERLRKAKEQFESVLESIACSAQFEEQDQAIDAIKQEKLVYILPQRNK